jgi:hypothetical protein
MKRCSRFEAQVTILSRAQALRAGGHYSMRLIKNMA